MRTTLTMDDDVLIAAKAIARTEGRSVGEVVSRLARAALMRAEPSTERNGIPLLPRVGGPPVVTIETVNTLRDEGR